MRGFTLPEAVIALAIITLSIVILSTFAINYISILNSIKQRFLALNFAQEGLEFALALRNKQIEGGSFLGPPGFVQFFLGPLGQAAGGWLGIRLAGSYCFSFESQTQRIIVQPSSAPCEIIPGYRRLVTYYDFSNPSNSDLTNSNAVRIISEVFFGRERINLDTVITRWHPTQ